MGVKQQVSLDKYNGYSFKICFFVTGDWGDWMYMQLQGMLQIAIRNKCHESDLNNARDTVRI